MKESTLKDILNSYEKRRDKAQSDLEQRILDVYAQIPRVKEIDNEISNTNPVEEYTQDASNDIDPISENK